MNVEEIGNPARGRIKVEGRCVLLSPPNFTLRGYSGGKDKTRTTGDPKRFAACCQRSKIAGNCLTLARRAGLSLENRSQLNFRPGIRATAARVGVRLQSDNWGALNGCFHGSCQACSPPRVASLMILRCKTHLLRVVCYYCQSSKQQ